MVTKTFYQLITGINGYKPKDRHFTSKEEIGYLTEKLELNEMTPLELQNLRDMVVMMYTDKMKTNTDERWEIMMTMQSITAVIDHIKYSR